MQVVGYYRQFLGYAYAYVPFYAKRHVGLIMTRSHQTQILVGMLKSLHWINVREEDLIAPENLPKEEQNLSNRMQAVDEQNVSDIQPYLYSF